MAFTGLFLVWHTLAPVSHISSFPPPPFPTILLDAPNLRKPCNLPPNVMAVIVPLLLFLNPNDWGNIPRAIK